MSARRTAPTSTARKAAQILQDHEPEIDLLATQEDEPQAVVPARAARGAGRRQLAQGAEDDDVVPAQPRSGRKTVDVEEDQVPEPEPEPVAPRNPRATRVAAPAPEPEEQEEEARSPVTARRTQTRVASRAVAPQEDAQEDDDLTHQSLRKAPRSTNAQKITVEAATKTARQPRVKAGGLETVNAKSTEAKFESVFDKNDYTDKYLAECFENKFDDLRDEINKELAVIAEVFKKQPKATPAPAAETEGEVVPAVAPKGKRAVKA